jgi:ubiquinone/menaquinone biosynthesis C-methylase UbiE
MHERRFHRAIEKLRAPDRVARMEVTRTIKLALEGLVEPKSVLDVGTGSGLFAEAFAVRGLQVSGVDANPAMIPVAQGFIPEATFKVGIAEELPFGDSEFDLVFMGLVLHETDERAKAMQEAFRVCRQRLAVLEWPYLKQEFGPGFDERIPMQTIQEMGIQAGFKQMVENRLKNLTLYCFEK